MASRNPFHLQMWQHVPLLCWSLILPFQGQPLILGQIKQGDWHSWCDITWLMNLDECLDFSCPNLLILSSFDFIHSSAFTSFSPFWGDICLCSFPLLRLGMYLKRTSYFLLKKLRVENSLSIFHHLSNDVLVGKGGTGLGVRRHGSHLESVTDQWEDFESTPSFPLGTSMCSSVKSDGTMRWLLRF